MDDKQAKKRWKYTSGSRFLLTVIGFTLILISPIIGAIPGPGFIIVFPIGLALVLQNSRWAKKRYVDSPIMANGPTGRCAEGITRHFPTILNCPISAR